jgi:hypothetical protein
MLDQPMPFQYCTRAVPTPFAVNAPPTAKQVVGLGHDTPVRSALPVLLAVVITDHVVPFQRSINVRLAPFGPPPPTAKQLVALAHDTAASPLEVKPVRSGPRVIDQVVPSQCSSTCLANPFGRTHSPTAKQLCALGHDTPFSEASEL